MALTAAVTKKSVVYVQSRLHSITFNLVLSEAAVPVLDEDFPVQFHTGDTAAAKVAQVVGLMQERIDQYKSAQAIFGSAALNTAVTNIQSQLVV